MMMTPPEWHQTLLVGFSAASVLVFVSLQFLAKAAYGRHKPEDGKKAWWWGLGIPTRAAWIIMEAPSSIGFGIIFFMGDQALEVVPLLLFFMWQAHYFQRSFVYPFVRKVQPGDTTPLMIPLLAFLTNIGISFLNAAILSWSSIRGGYDLSWLTDPRFIAGVAIFLTGYWINRKADAMLAALRAPGESGYKIPRGWLYEKISCPNYFGEIMIWVGWAVATWSMAGVVFVVWTLANLLPRALSNHAWYQDKFDDYPAERKAVFPGVL